MYKQSATILALLFASSLAIDEVPDSKSLFATGMNGDEDLGQDITMKGQKYHYQQDKSFVQLKTNGSKNNKKTPEPEKVHVLDPEAAIAAANDRNVYPNPERTAFYAQIESQKVKKNKLLKPKVKKIAKLSKKYNKAVKKIQAKAAKKAQAKKAKKAAKKAKIAAKKAKPLSKKQIKAARKAAKLAKKAQAAKSVPEKVSVLDTPICKTHTTFYAQQDQQSDAKPLSDISDQSIDRDVYDFVKYHVPRKPYPRDEFPPETSKSLLQAPSEKKNPAVNPEGMNPWVYRTTINNIDRLPQWHDIVSQPPPELPNYYYPRYRSYDSYSQSEPLVFNNRYGLWMMQQSAEPEKVHILEPEVYQQRANTNRPNIRTTFYSQKPQQLAEPEKVHILEPEVYQERANTNKPNIRTTFYGQAPQQLAEPEKVSVLEPEVYQDRANTNKPNIRTTFYAPIDQENIEFRI